MKAKKIRVDVNGRRYEADVSANRLLLDFVREDLSLTGTKWGCLTGDCGACTVLLDGQPVNSCIMLAAEVDGSKILTVEGLARNGELDPLQKAFIEKGAAQCGYCTPGILMNAKSLLEKHPRPDESEVRYWLAGNLCRCTGYNKIVEAVLDASRKVKGGR